MKRNKKPLIPPPKGYKAYLVGRFTERKEDGSHQLTEVNVLVKMGFWERYGGWIIAAFFFLLGAYKIWVGDWQL